MKNSINYYTREERSGVTLLLTFVMLFTVFVFIQKVNITKSVTMNVHVESIPNKTEMENNIIYSTLEKSDHISSFKPGVKKGNKNASLNKAIKKAVVNNKIVKDTSTSLFEKERISVRKNKVEQKFAKTAKFKNYQRKESEKISLSAYNEEDWQKLRGIGKVFSKRIIKYKNWLGGFHTVEQLKEVYGMTDSLYRTIEPFIISDVKIKYININTCNVKQLGKHPYINWKDAKKIIAYRKQHGSYKNISDLDKIIGLDKAKIEKFKPYMSLKNNLHLSKSSEEVYAQNEGF